MKGKLALGAVVVAAWLLTYLVLGGHLWSDGTTPPRTPTSTTSGGLSFDDGVTFSLPPKPRRTPAPPPVLTFTIGSLDVLTSASTGLGTPHPLLGKGPARARTAAGVLVAGSASVIGLQEIDASERAAFFAVAGSTFDSYPGSVTREANGENPIIWRTADWDLVGHGSLAIPYVNGTPRVMPIVLLKNRRTGLKAWFANFDNPADLVLPARPTSTPSSTPTASPTVIATPSAPATTRSPDQSQWRKAAKTAEIARVLKLKATGLPVFVTGAMQEDDAFFCEFVPDTGLVAAAGGETSGACMPPIGDRLDWILGSPAVTFSHYLMDRDEPIPSVTGHPLVLSTARIDGADFPKAVGSKGPAA